MSAASRPTEVEIVAARLRVDLDRSLNRVTPAVLRAAARLYDDPTLPWPPPPDHHDDLGATDP